MRVTIEQAAEAFRAKFGREPEAEVADSCWLAGYAAALSAEPEEYPCPPDCQFKNVPHAHALCVIGRPAATTTTNSMGNDQ